jgi:predicted nucleotidyltransferase
MNERTDERIPELIAPVVRAASSLPGVAAISLGGSYASGTADAASDVDLHVYWREPLAERATRHAALAAVADAGSQVREVGEWGLEDHLYVGGRLVELIYVHLGNLEALVDRAYGEGLSDEGFATTQLAYVAGGAPLLDSRGELAALRERLASYPEATRRRLLSGLPELLRAYLGQLRKAQARGDLLFVQHRRYTVQMVFFNLLFALNRRYHPGEKRLLAHGERCRAKPERMTERWEGIARLPADDPALAEGLEELVDDLGQLVEALEEGER